MAATVFANGLAVATTKSDHIAHSTEPDVRLVDDKVPTPLLNYLESEALFANLPSLTEFDGGKIWTSPSELGPKSKPVDTWPGAKNGGIKNGKVTAASGQGSPNVFVEGDKVLCYTHLTKQNAGNSAGIIDDRAGFEAYKKKLEAQAKNLPPAKPKHGGAHAKGKTGTGDTRKPNEHEKPKLEHHHGEEAETCTLEAVLMTHAEERKQSSGQGDRDAKIEVVPRGARGDDEVELEADIAKACGDHPVWTIARPGGSTIDHGTKIKVAVSRLGNTFPTTMAGFRQACSVRPDRYVVVAKAHQGVFNRVIDVYPGGPTRENSVGLGEFWEGAKPIKEKVEGKLKPFFVEKLGCEVDVALFEGQLSVSIAWHNVTESEKEVKNWQVYCEAKITGELTIFELKIDKTFLFENWPIPAPPVKAVQLFVKCLNEVWEEVFDHKLLVAGPFIRLGGKLAAEAAVARRVYTQGEPEWRGELAGVGAASLDVGFHVVVGKNFLKAECAIGGSLELRASGEGSRAGLEVKVTVGFPPVKGTASFSWNFGSFVDPKAGFWEKLKGATLNALIPVQGEKKFEIELTEAHVLTIYQGKFFE